MKHKILNTPLGPVKYIIDPALGKQFKGKVVFHEKIEKGREIFKKTGHLK